MDGTVYIATCIDNTVVVLPRMIKVGDGVFYDAYTLDDDVRTYGYIHTIEQGTP